MGLLTVVGSCGETNERVAARFHAVVAGLWRLEAIAAGVLGIVAVAIVVVSLPAIRWHRTSVGVHLDRASAKGE